ncbi:MFS transporter [Microlunatus flavus]|uniref:Major Facilitator Superfamily protein n=1 Tax=Microlunatus flavus TaxID=1036181 RepID=A0A1H8ZMA8_9ACTN|nr:MFS transporter [Microlunatus flavus]SEP65535.1 Major Facilitator Superfamily protein [Microlunatus flavus]
MSSAPGVVRHLAVAQAFFIAASSVDLTLTGIVGASVAPRPDLATLPFSLLFVAGGLTTFLASRSIGRFGHRATFVAAGLVAAGGGTISALAIARGSFVLFCLGTAVVGASNATAGYYRYLAADTNPATRARAVSTVLAGGLVAALAGPFVATALRDVTRTPYVASYLLVAALGLGAAAWNTRLRVPAPNPSGGPHPSVATAPPRAYGVLWRQPVLLLGTVAVVTAALTMLALMTAGPILGLNAGRTPGQAALAIQLHLVGMFAPGFVVPRVVGRLGERRVAALGCAVIVVAGLAAAGGAALPLYLTAMFAVGVGWNLAYSGGSAMIASAYRPSERGRVQPVAEVLGIAAQVGGSFAAAGFTTETSWRALGWATVAVAVVVGTLLVAHRARVEPPPAVDAPA